MKNSDITILIDVDDTIEDLCGAWCKQLNNKYGTNVQKEDVTDWDIHKFFPMLTREQVFEPIHRDDFWKAVEPKQDAIEYVKRLLDEGFQVYLCTSTDYRNVWAKYEYVIKPHFPYIEWSNVIIAYKKQMVKADFLIDDGIHNLEGGEYIKILMTAPHNKFYDATANGIYRVNNWKEIYKIIHKYVETQNKEHLEDDLSE